MGGACFPVNTNPFKKGKVIKVSKIIARYLTGRCVSEVLRPGTIHISQYVQVMVDPRVPLYQGELKYQDP